MSELPEEQPLPDSPLRAASWNIQSCRRGLPGIVEHLKGLELDLVALQEVDRRTGRCGGIDQAEVIARDAGFAHYQFFRATDLDGGEYGLALLSKLPLGDAQLEPLPVKDGLEPRILASATLTHPLGRLGVHLTHLSHRLGNARLRYGQAHHLARRVVGLQSPQLILGDFNGLARSQMYRELSDWFIDVFRAVGEGPGGTHPLMPLVPAVRIDYLFASRDLLLERARVVPTRASDHHLLMAEVRLPAGEAIAEAAPPRLHAANA